MLFRSISPFFGDPGLTAALESATTLTEFGVAAVVVLELLIESVNCTIPATAVVAAPILTLLEPETTRP